MLVVPVSETTNALNIGWENYKSWDLIQLTQNYLKLILAYIQVFNSLDALLRINYLSNSFRTKTLVYWCIASAVGIGLLSSFPFCV